MRKPVRHIGEPATLDELALLVAALPERLRLMIELAAWCALPFGEVAELRRGDIDLKNGVTGSPEPSNGLTARRSWPHPRPTAPEWSRSRRTSGRRPDDPTCASMTFVTPEPLSRPRQAPRSPS